MFCGINSQQLQHVFECCLSALTQTFCHSFIALPIIRCTKSAQKFAVQVFQVTTVIMETTQLVLSQFKKNFLS